MSSTVELSSIEPYMARLLDVFPTHKILIGGSTAVNFALANPVVSGDVLANPVVSGDVDVYLSLHITRYMFRDILTHLVFSDRDIIFNEDEYSSTFPGDISKYKMSFIRRRIQVEVLGLATFDFVFVDLPLSPYYTLKEYLFKEQATSFTEVALKFSPWAEKRQLWSLYTSDNFKSDLSAGLFRRNKENSTTKEHESKVIAKLQELGMSLKT